MIIYLDPSTLVTVRLPSGRVVVQADGVDHRVSAIATMMNSGRVLLEQVLIWHNGNRVRRDAYTSLAFEEAREEMLGVLRGDVTAMRSIR